MKKSLFFSVVALTLGVMTTSNTVVVSAATQENTLSETTEFNVASSVDNHYAVGSLETEKTALPHTSAPGGVPGGWSRVPGHSDVGWKVWPRR